MEPTCNLIIDSCCDLPRELVDRPGITLLSFPYRFGEAEYRDDLFLTTTAGDFYGRMRKDEHPSTAQMPLASLVDICTTVLQSGVPTVYLSFSSALSGNLDSLLNIYDHLKPDYPDAEFYIVDTKLASIAEGLLVLGAIAQRDKGLSARELAAWAEEARYFVNEQFMVDDLESLHRGGRLSGAVAFVGSKLDVKPMLDITVDGALSLTGLARGRKKGLKRLAAYFEEHRGTEGLDPLVIIGSADAPKDAARLRDEILHIDDSVIIVETSIGPVIGSHVGPGMVAITFWGVDARESLSTSDRIARKVTGEA